MLTGAGFVTVPVPVGVTVTVYVRAGSFEPPPQAIRKPAIEMAIAVSSTATARLRRNVNGAPSSTAQNITTLFQGSAGAQRNKKPGIVSRALGNSSAFFAIPHSPKKADVGHPVLIEDQDRGCDGRRPVGAFVANCALGDICRPHDFIR